MRKLSLCLGILLMLSSEVINAQDIFEQHGFDKKPLTLSNGRYNEFFSNDELVQIGTVILNTKSNEIVAFIDEDTAKAAYLAEYSSRWLTLDPLARKYPQVSPYVYCINNPIIFTDPDGKDILCMVDYQGANGTGHQAVMIGNAKNHYTYISKDGYTGKNPLSPSKSLYTIEKFNSIDEFKNSKYNFELAEGSMYSDKNPVFKLDKDGNKIQRYDDGFSISTDQKTDIASTFDAMDAAKSDYQLTQADCSDVVTDALEGKTTSDGQEIKTGENGVEFDAPTLKQVNIVTNNPGTPVDLTPKKDENQ